MFSSHVARESVKKGSSLRIPWVRGVVLASYLVDHKGRNLCSQAGAITFEFGYK
jgi:hypothetical protein